jgi:hypothetical protein
MAIVVEMFRVIWLFSDLFSFIFSSSIIFLVAIRLYIANKKSIDVNVDKY